MKPYYVSPDGAIVIGREMSELAYNLIMLAQQMRCYIKIEPDDGDGWFVTVGNEFHGTDRDLTKALLKAWTAFADVPR